MTIYRQWSLNSSKRLRKAVSGLVLTDQTGLLKCSGCLRQMTPVHTTKSQGKKLYRYYTATGYRKGRCPDCPVKHISAGEVESQVLQQIQALLTVPDVILDTWKAAKKIDANITETDVHQALRDLAPVWQSLFPAEQKRLLQLLLTQVILHPDHLDIQIRINGIQDLAQQLRHHQPPEATPCKLSSP